MFERSKDETASPGLTTQDAVLVKWYRIDDTTLINIEGIETSFKGIWILCVQSHSVRQITSADNPKNPECNENPANNLIHDLATISLLHSQL